MDLYVLERALLSTHPNTEWMFGEIIQGYSEASAGATTEVIKKFEDIRVEVYEKIMGDSSITQTKAREYM